MVEAERGDEGHFGGGGGGLQWVGVVAEERNI